MKKISFNEVTFVILFGATLGLLSFFVVLAMPVALGILGAFILLIIPFLIPFIFHSFISEELTPLKALLAFMIVYSIDVSCIDRGILLINTSDEWKWDSWAIQILVFTAISWVVWIVYRWVINRKMKKPAPNIG